MLAVIGSATRRYFTISALVMNVNRQPRSQRTSAAAPIRLVRMSVDPFLVVSNGSYLVTNIGAMNLEHLTEVIENRNFARPRNQSSLPVLRVTARKLGAKIEMVNKRLLPMAMSILLYSGSPVNWSVPKSPAKLDVNPEGRLRSRLTESPSLASVSQWITIATLSSTIRSNTRYLPGFSVEFAGFLKRTLAATIAAAIATL